MLFRSVRKQEFRPQTPANRPLLLPFSIEAFPISLPEELDVPRANARLCWHLSHRNSAPQSSPSRPRRPGSTASGMRIGQINRLKCSLRKGKGGGGNGGGAERERLLHELGTRGPQAAGRRGSGQGINGPGGRRGPGAPTYLARSHPTSSRLQGGQRRLRR